MFVPHPISTAHQEQTNFILTMADLTETTRSSIVETTSIIAKTINGQGL